MPSTVLQNLNNNIKNQIVCAKCEAEYIAEKPINTSLQEYSLLDVGFTDVGLQVWCRRHNVNVVHVDFGGNKLKADFRALETKIQ